MGSGADAHADTGRQGKPQLSPGQAGSHAAHAVASRELEEAAREVVLRFDANLITRSAASGIALGEAVARLERALPAAPQEVDA